MKRQMTTLICSILCAALLLQGCAVTNIKRDDTLVVLEAVGLRLFGLIY